MGQSKAYQHHSPMTKRSMINLLGAFLAGFMLGSARRQNPGVETAPSVRVRDNDNGSALTAVEKAHMKLADALKDAWDLNEETALFTNARGGVSAPRFMLNRFVDEVSKQMPTLGPVCMDWSSRYVEQFENCKQVVNYEYSNTENVYTSGELIKGDLGEPMDFVPDQVLDFILCTQVFEHVPHPWKAFTNLARFIKPGGVMVFTVPWAYHFHPMPGDFYRYSPMAIHHLLESSGFAVCHFVSDGWRSLQMHALGLEVSDIGDESYLTDSTEYSKIVGAANYNVLAQRVDNIGDPCNLPTAMKFTNEVPIESWKQKTRGFWPPPMENFPFGNSVKP